MSDHLRGHTSDCMDAYEAYIECFCGADAHNEKVRAEQAALPRVPVLVYDCSVFGCDDGGMVLMGTWAENHGVALRQPETALGALCDLAVTLGRTRRQRTSPRGVSEVDHG